MLEGEKGREKGREGEGEGERERGGGGGGKGRGGGQAAIKSVNHWGEKRGRVRRGKLENTKKHEAILNPRIFVISRSKLHDHCTRFPMT